LSRIAAIPGTRPRTRWLHLHVSWLNLDFIEQLHAQDFLAHAANLNSETEIEQGIAWNIDQFSTEHIELAVAKRRLDRDFRSA